MPSGILRRTRKSPSTTTLIVVGDFLAMVSGHSVTNFSTRHEAQPCYCGEPNCIGVLGGKTQTDVAAMDDITLDGASYVSLPLCGVFKSK